MGTNKRNMEWLTRRRGDAEKREKREKREKINSIMRKRKNTEQTKRGTRPSVMVAREDGQEAHPQRACTDLTNYTSQAAAAFERRPFWLLFGPLQKVTSPHAVRIDGQSEVPSKREL